MIPGRCCGLPLVYGHGATQPSAGQVAKNTHNSHRRPPPTVHRPSAGVRQYPPLPHRRLIAGGWLLPQLLLAHFVCVRHSVHVGGP